MDKEYIPITSCHSCNPDTWVAKEQSVGLYKCRKCKKIVKYILYKKGA